MSLTEIDVRRLLATAMAFDNRKAGDANVLAWMCAAERGRWTFDEAIDAIEDHGTNRTEFLMPSMVTQHIKAARQDRAMREPVVHPDPIGQRRLLELVSNAFNAISDPADPADPGDAARRAALARACPYCQAGAGQPCTRSGLTGRIRTTKPHPSRLEESA